ncbi:unnamed protein product [Cyprideis torosa]|uniref:Uncharacterized protein n=1 Tax=Cyprideis torosa TaxID=163714 RepID=A0A7R8W8Z6_9CRUS|nr:unnamed protein product [Cyprideis torosa]CAG0889206.1 unnamed protein product [Cyprideis torosa]
MSDLDKILNASPCPDAEAFGLGSMIYCGLEFGAFWETPMGSGCYNLILGINPCLQLVFTFLQMYFIFMNARLNIHKFKFLARFGLMHVVATNVCVWLRTIVREALKDITIHLSKEDEGPTLDHMVLVNRTTSMSYLANWNVSCERRNLIGTIRQDSAPFLYPFLVEYSLIGAIVLYIMWKHVGLNPKFKYNAEDPEYLSVQSSPPPCRVDCVGASKGFFLGLLVLVAAVICLILYFVFIANPDMKQLALYLADASHGGILLLCILTIVIGFCRLVPILTIVIGFCRVRQLRFFPEREDFVNTLFLRISAFGILLYALFSTIAGSMYIVTEFDEPHILVMVVNLLVGIEVFLQALFVNDVARRSIYLEEHIGRRPGRQCVTLLLLCNLAMTVIYVFEMQKLDFYGYIPWNVILKLTLPLSIFHRFHASVMLADVWKNTYKVRCIPPDPPAVEQ